MKAVAAWSADVQFSSRCPTLGDIPTQHKFGWSHPAGVEQSRQQVIRIRGKNLEELSGDGLKKRLRFKLHAYFVIDLFKPCDGDCMCFH